MRWGAEGGVKEAEGDVKEVKEAEGDVEEMKEAEVMVGDILEVDDITSGCMGGGGETVVKIVKRLQLEFLDFSCTSFYSDANISKSMLSVWEFILE